MVPLDRPAPAPAGRRRRHAGATRGPPRAAQARATTDRQRRALGLLGRHLPGQPRKRGKATGRQERGQRSSQDRACRCRERGWQDTRHLPGRQVPPLARPLRRHAGRCRHRPHDPRGRLSHARHRCRLSGPGRRLLGPVQSHRSANNMVRRLREMGYDVQVSTPDRAYPPQPTPVKRGFSWQDAPAPRGQGVGPSRGPALGVIRGTPPWHPAAPHVLRGKKTLPLTLPVAGQPLSQPAARGGLHGNPGGPPSRMLRER